MISNQEEDEFIAVRVQDPRVQSEGSWNSYVDYKIFLHTNSKAFTAKTSCVRRRYSEFAWLKKKLQKNAGLVPVPDLPGKSLFSFSNEDFLEGRRKGLQAFLDQVVHMTVCLSDSQLHLFLQTQLPVGHIQDCVQGHTPYSVTDAILTYASSNRGFAQAQEDDSVKESSLTVSYESMESPVPHQPSLQTKVTSDPELVLSADSDPLDEKKSSVKVLQKNNHLEAVIEDCDATKPSFFLGDGPDGPESLGPAEQTQQRSCRIQTPVEVHSPMGPDVELNGVCSVREESLTTSDPEEKTEEDNIQHLETEPCGNSLDLKLSDVRAAQEDVLEDVRSETERLETPVTSEMNSLGHSADSSSPEKTCDGQKEAEDISDQEEIQEERGDAVDQQEVDPVGTKDESEDEDSRSSSNESIVQVSDEESVCDEAEESIDASHDEEVALWSEASSRNILDLQVIGCPAEETEDDLRYTTKISDFSKSLDVISSVTGGDLTENSDFSVIETSCSPVLADSKCTEEEVLSLDAAEETR